MIEPCIQALRGDFKLFGAQEGSLISPLYLYESMS